ncbi:AAA family ATPase [Desulfosarcina sp.]|uniref:AAA family ATPase n=1 Tax=Desulfosarcina sp. TaxID=2027861 RepID=UPI0035638BAA
MDASKASGLTDYIGRDDELHNLRKALKKAQSGQGQVVGVVGGAGIGKSRLVLGCMARRMRHAELSKADGFNTAAAFLSCRCLRPPKPTLTLGWGHPRRESMGS